MKNNKTVIIIAVLLLVTFVSFSVKSMFVEKSVPTKAVREAVEGEILLSWGKFNYAPEVITVKAGEPVRIRADLDRITGCFRSFTIDELGIKQYFTENNPVIEFTPETPGSYKFGCQMGMGRGTLVVQ